MNVRSRSAQRYGATTRPPPQHQPAASKHRSDTATEAEREAKGSLPHTPRVWRRPRRRARLCSSGSSVGGPRCTGIRVRKRRLCEPPAERGCLLALLLALLSRAVLSLETLRVRALRGMVAVFELKVEAADRVSVSRAVDLPESTSGRCRLPRVPAVEAHADGRERVPRRDPRRDAGSCLRRDSHAGDRHAV